MSKVTIKNLRFSKPEHEWQVRVDRSSVLGRLLSGVHWITDIIGGALLSAGVVMSYSSISNTRTKC